MFDNFNGITLLAIVGMAFLILWAYTVHLAQRDREDEREKEFERYREYLMHLESMAEYGIYDQSGDNPTVNVLNLLSEKDDFPGDKSEVSLDQDNVDSWFEKDSE